MAPISTKLVTSIRQDGSPVEAIIDGDTVAFGTIDGVTAGRRTEAVDWSDCIVERCRFSAAVIAESFFERVVFHDCDFTGLTFVNCLIRDCIVLGIKSKSHFVLDNCILDGLSLDRSDIDRLEVHGCRIGALTCTNISARQILFHHCRSLKRTGGEISLSDSDLAQVSGLDSLAKAGITLRVDSPLWRDLGDSLLRERGIEEVEQSKAGLTDELAELSTHLRAIQ